MTATGSETAAPANGGRCRLEAIEPDPRREGSLRLSFGGRTRVTVSQELLRAEGWREGDVLDVDALERLSQAADEEAAFQTALRMLERRPFARKDLGRRLAHRGHPAESVSRALDRAARLGLVNDRTFAQHYVQTRLARGRGPARLIRELGVLGVDRQVIDEALARDFSDPEVARAMAERLARRRLGQLAGLQRAALRQRVLAFLARRGYTGEQVRRLVDGLLAERSGGSSSHS